MSSLYLVSNNLNLRKEIFSDYKEDIFNGDVIHFNTIQYFHYFEDHPRNIVFHNADLGKCDWFGKEKMSYYTQYSIKDRYLLYIQLMNSPSWLPKLNEWKEHGGNILEYRGKSHLSGSSAGFMCYNYFSDFYNKIYLIGFTFEGSPVHPWEYEKPAMLNDPKVTLLI